MKLLFENWRNYSEEEVIVQELLKESTTLDEGAVRDAIRKLKTIFYRSIAAATGGDNALSDFIKAYADMVESNFIGNDQYFHCVANCMASDRGWKSMRFAEVFSELREFFDQYVKRDSQEACDEDREANLVGQSGTGHCADRCEEFIPRGLPCKYIDKYSGEQNETPT
jgi:hypothetical protein|tara:strand:+ start:90 stop:593 length:504 start_codon:yes stop_codon:yes gene_type:complete